jgi:type VI protein secretion system component VasF
MSRLQNTYKSTAHFFRDFPMKVLILFACIYGLSSILPAKGSAILGLVVITGALIWVTRQDRYGKNTKHSPVDLFIPIIAVCAYAYSIAVLVGGSGSGTVKTVATATIMVVLGLFFVYSLYLMRKTNQLLKEVKANRQVPQP